MRMLPLLLLLLTAAAPQIDHPWARASAGGARNGAAFLTVTGTAADRLTGAASPVADKVELHESIDDNGVMKMRPVAFVAVTPGKPAELKPGGRHVMLMGLRAPLKVGDTFPLTLRFETAGEVTVTVTVEAVAGGHRH